MDMISMLIGFLVGVLTSYISLGIFLYFTFGSKLFKMLEMAETFGNMGTMFEMDTDFDSEIDDK